MISDCSQSRNFYFRLLSVEYHDVLDVVELFTSESRHAAETIVRGPVKNVLYMTVLHFHVMYQSIIASCFVKCLFANQFCLFGWYCVFILGREARR